MKKIIAYELTKFFKKRKNKLLILVLCIFVLAVNIYNYKLFKDFNDKFMEEYKLISEQTKLKLNSLNNELMGYSEWNEEEREIYEERIQKIEGMINYLRVEAAVTGRISNAYRRVEDPQWNSLLCKYLRERYTNVIEAYEKGFIDDIYLRERKTNIEEARYYQYKYNYFLNNNILLKENKYEPKGINSLNLLFMDSNILVLIIVIALLSMDFFLLPVLEGSYKLEYTYPLKRKNIFIGKLVSIFIILFGLVAILFLLSFIINSIIFGLGDFTYPQVVSDTINKLSLKGNEGSFTVISLGHKIALGVIMTFALILFTVALIVFLSIFTDSLEKTLGITMVLIIAAFTFHIIASKESALNLFYPYMYCYFENIISGFYRSNYMLGIIMNIGFSVFFIFISYLKFTRKDFLGFRE
ncbi:MAG: ABC transporter permease subunit [Tissierellia bacterium]|nr:ABC transporter permease subunit [Tissierellia bacterium]